MMTKDEIKEGLEFCKANWCVMCPYCNCIGCDGFLKQDALNLITEQEQKIENLNGIIDYADKENRQLKTECALLDDELRNARQNTINVLNELKSKCHNYYPSIDHYCCSVKAVTLSDINNIIKELIK